MKRVILIAFFCQFIAFAAHAADAYTTANINLRAGPDGGYPVIETLKRGERVELLGCLGGLQWCEVETRNGEHGWVYAHYLNTSDNGRAYTIIQSNGTGGLRILTFRPRYYWDTYYRKKPFYRDRDRWLPPRDYDHDRDRDHVSNRPRPNIKPKPSQPPKYQEMPSPSRKKYNPLCAMGETDC